MEKENHPYYIKSVSTPIEIVDAEDINSREKWFLTNLHVLENGEKGCFATNQYFAKKHKISVRQVQKILSNLLNLRYIYIKFENSQPGKQKRFIKLNKAKFFGIEEIQNNYNGCQKQPYELNKTVAFSPHEKNSPAPPLNKDVDTNTEILQKSKRAPSSLAPPSFKDSKLKFEFDKQDLENAETLLSHFKKLDANLKPPKIEEWSNQMRLLRTQKGGRSQEEIQRALTWMATGDKKLFWLSTFSSASGFRGNFDTIIKQANALKKVDEIKYPKPDEKKMKDLQEYIQNVVNAGLREHEIMENGVRIKNTELFVHFGDPAFKEKLRKILENQQEIT